MTVFQATASGRLDACLVAADVVRSRTQARSIIECGGVTVQGVIATKPKHRVWEGDTVVVDDAVRMQEREQTLPAVDLSLSILYEDDDCLVIDKPDGVVVHPAIGVAKDEPTVLHGAAFLFAQRNIPFSEEGVLVHRLDRETTGCLLLAKSMDAHARLQHQFQDRTVRKEYLALVAGIPRPPAAMIDAPVGRSTVDRTRMAVVRTAASREARTAYRTVGTGEGAALVLCDLLTGRTHQVRVHLSSVGYPILGDPTYSTAASERVSHALGVCGLCLHAWKLAFHDRNGRQVSVVAPLPNAMQQALHSAGIALPLPHAAA